MKRAVATALLAVVPFIASPTLAQNQSAQDTVVATVDGSNIYASDVVALYQSLPPQYRQQPLSQLSGEIVERLIEQTLVANAARSSGLEKTPEVQRQIKMLTDGVLQQAYLEQKISAQMTDEKLKEAYRKRIASQPAAEEIRARHILLKTEETARAVIVELETTGDFAAAAKKHSTGPSAAQGGDLGFFSDGMMVPEFSKAAFALKTGEITKSPVKTQFGWHVIKLEERRRKEAPSFDQVAPELRQDIGRQAYDDILSGLRAQAKIEIKGPSPQPAQK